MFALLPYVQAEKCRFSDLLYFFTDITPTVANKAWQSKVKGMFTDAKKWLGQSVPKKNSVVVLAGSRVESKKV